MSDLFPFLLPLFLLGDQVYYFFIIESLNQYDDFLGGIYTREGAQQVFTVNYNCFATLDLVATSLFILISEERHQNWPIYYR